MSEDVFIDMLEDEPEPAKPIVVKPSPAIRSELDYLVARNVMIETLYQKMEEHLPCEPMSDEMLARMNESLGFSGDAAKDRDYRPYCVRKGCQYMPRMMRVPEGFLCWSCHNRWDLRPQCE